MVFNFSKIVILVCSLGMFSIDLGASAQSNNGSGGAEAWERFRSIAPHHMQDWILVGEGPVFTLIHSEPPPAYDRAGYEAIYQATFRGIESFDTKSDLLGFNGSYTDIVATMDYGFAGEDALSELEIDLRALSQEIYGTSYGSRVLRLRDLEQKSPARNAGTPIEISAAEVHTWLNDSGLVFASPETGVSGSLDQIRQQRGGRYLSSDGALVLLIIDRGAQLGFADVRHIRHFVLDSDLIVGGMIDEAHELTYVVGRARQLDWFDFPPLRVEDVLNLIEQEHGSLAQSYDRTTPGAGRVTHEGQQQDWAPSFLSKELLDTEFGSLLNEADAVLKSQSLGDTISYVGFDIDGIPSPPDDTSEWPRGVWDRLNAEIRLTSLIFNFNTVGSGHWYFPDEENVRVYAPNRTGSYSVTYSPFGAGETSLNREAALIAEAEREYGAWFNASGNLALARAVQYTSIFQIFAEPGNVVSPGYPDRDRQFETIGNSLRTAIVSGFEVCLPLGALGDERFAELQRRYQAGKLLQSLGFSRGLPSEFPKDREELLRSVAEAATEFRYDGNVFGSEVEELVASIEAMQRQREAALPDAETALAEYEAQVAKLREAPYRVEARVFDATDRFGKPEFDEFGNRKQKVGLFKFGSEWNPRSTRERSERDEWSRLLRVSNAKVGYYNGIVVELDRLFERYDRLFLESGNRKQLAQFVARQCDDVAETNDFVFDAYIAKTVEIDESAEEVPFLRTPTIVLSRNELDENFLGGHNVERQGLEVRLGSVAETGTDGFSLVGNRLTVSSNRASELPTLSEAMAKVRNADPVTQKAVFDAAISSNPASRRAPNQALGIDDQASRASYSVEFPTGRADTAALPPDNGLRLGWGERGMFMDQRVDGEVRRSNLFGASYGLPQLLESRLAAHRVAVVEFDATLDAATRETVIDNFVRERPAAAAGGGGKGGDGNGRWRVAGASPEGPNRGPRLAIFRDTTTGKSRIVLETTRGRMELVLEQTARRDEVLEALSKRIEQGARLELSEVKVATDGAGGRAILTDFVVRQDSSFDGSVGGFTARGLDAANRTIAEAFGSALRRAFSRVTRERVQNNSNGDLLIEFQKSAMETGYFRRVVGKVVIDDHGMRWILFVEPHVTGPVINRLDL